NVCYARFASYDNQLLTHLGFNPLRFHPQNLLIKSLIIVPPIVRPYRFKDNKRQEDDIVTQYKKIINLVDKLHPEYENATDPKHKEDFYKNLSELILHIGKLTTKKVNKVSFGDNKNNQNIKTIPDRIKTKEGIIRDKIIGKRINGSARLVISVDPLIPIDYIGIPKVVAMTLLIPVTVNEYNMDECYRYIQNGPDVYPGAKIIQGINKKGKLGNFIIHKDPEKRKKIKLEVGQKVMRHMMDGDYCLFNRQPTLHKYGMFGFKVTILDDYSTFRINPADVTPFNADFDGDEMHMIVFSRNTSKAEIEYITKITNSIMTMSQNTVQIHPIHDGVTGLYKMSIYKKKLTRRQFMYIFSNCDETIDYNFPSKSEYTTKDVFSQLLPDLNVNSKGIKIEGGIFKEGIITKQTMIMLISIVYRRFGAEVAQSFIYNLQQIALTWGSMEGHTCSLSDCDVPEYVEDRIKDKINMALLSIEQIHEEIQTNKFIVPIGQTIEDYFESTCMSKIMDCMDGMVNEIKSSREFNNLDIMTKCKARGNDSNIAQISGIIGQQQINGNRMKPGYKNRVFVYDPKYLDNPISRGFVINSYLKGMRYTEYVCHSMAGRNDLMDQKMKTPEVGYQTRKAALAMRNIKVEYDNTLRDENGKIVQFVYSGDGMKVDKLQSVEIPEITYSDREFDKIFI
ncbi:MAG: hypothetical protein ACOCRK_00580, partial [bacterium]